MILIDRPIWPNHGTVFAHLISDTSIAELHAFASGLGVPERAFDGDHYDIPKHLVAEAIAAGATSVAATEIVRRLAAADLRLRKRNGERGVARLLDVDLGASLRGDVDLVASTRPAPEQRTGAVAVLVSDASGAVVVVHSRRRGTWDCPGGRREPGEGVEQCAVRELAEETGLIVQVDTLVPCGYQRITLTPPAERPYLQVFTVTVPGDRPPLTVADDELHAAEWLSRAGFAGRCGERFWWPLAARVLSSSTGTPDRPR